MPHLSPSMLATSVLLAATSAAARALPQFRADTSGPSADGGPRSYTLCSGAGSGATGLPQRSLDVHTLADGRRIASIALGEWTGAAPTPGDPWGPAFSADHSRGAAVVSARELVVFDNLAYGVVATLTVEQASARLIPDADGELAYVLEAAGAPDGVRIRALDLRAAAFVATLDLPDTCEPRWAHDESSGQAFVRDADPWTGRPLGRRVDLAGWRVLDALPLGTPRDTTVDWIEVEHGWLFAALRQGPSSGASSLTAVDLARPGASVSVPFGSQRPRPPVAVPSAGRLVVAAASGLGPASDEVYVAPIDAPQWLTWIAETPNLQFTFGPSVVRGHEVWVLTAPYDSDHAARLWVFDAQALAWRRTPEFWAFPWPVDLLSARGTRSDALLLPRSGAHAPPQDLEPAMLVLDPHSGALVDAGRLSWGPLASCALQAR